MKNRSKQVPANKESVAERLSRVLARFEWAQIEAVLSQYQPVSGAAAFLVRRIVESGALIVRHGGAALREKRDTCVDAAIAWLSANGTDQDAQVVRDHVASLRIIELGYEAVLAEMDAGPLAGLAADVHVWALIDILVGTSRQITADLKARLSAISSVTDPYRLHLRSDTGAEYRPDAIQGALGDVLASAIVMLGYKYGWFDGAGVVTLPAPVPVTEGDRFRAGLTYALGQAWRLLDISQERWRFFGGAVSAGKRDVLENGQLKSVDSIEFDAELDLEHLDEIAHERLNRLLMRVFTDLQIYTRWGHKVAPRGAAAQLPPDQFLGFEEIVTTLGLSSALHFPVVDDQERYGDLRFVEWIRGYSWLQREAEHAIKNALESPSWSAAQLEQALINAGLSSVQAIRFVNHVTFGRHHLDLFDAPLLQCADGRFRMIAAMVAYTSVPRVILSHLARLGLQIGKKGNALERRVAEEFRARGMHASGFKRKVGGEEYQCDVAVVWDRTLFLFECKNRSLSGLKPSRLLGFLDETVEGVQQLQRLVTMVECNPDVLPKEVGEPGSWDRIQPCVLHGMPFSIPGGLDGVPVYDASALFRFLESGTLSLNMPKRTSAGVTVLWRHHVYGFWSGSAPSGSDLQAQLEKPWQVEMLAQGYVVFERAVPLSRDRVLVSPFVRLQESGLESSLRALGVGDVSHELEEIREKMDSI